MEKRSELAGRELDRFDLAILKILQRDNKTPQRAIAETVGLSAPAVQRRVRRMEENGTIVANVAIVDPSSVRQEITLVVEVEMDSELGHLHDQAKRAFTQAPEIQQCYYVTGEIDFVLVITVRSMTDYEALSRRLFFGNNHVKRFRSFVAMDRVKVGLSLNLDARKEGVEARVDRRNA
ncbi:Lrp/AsnC family transcriptional regulator [Bradyrhizobium sp. NAS96.2]|uniref:Lrp/AsnC family transcriptional regulator n=1 Tax=Bradyrhizobium sp. NAS96.2 TaxID=1680160 RepID=UPI0011610531|nr:Lrp/AsnC family transcriptional regulator [Bradyrhizobium sp. NAS96.2]